MVLLIKVYHVAAKTSLVDPNVLPWGDHVMHSAEKQVITQATLRDPTFDRKMCWYKPKSPKDYP